VDTNLAGELGAFPVDSSLVGELGSVADAKNPGGVLSVLPASKEGPAGILDGLPAEKRFSAAAKRGKKQQLNYYSDLKTKPNETPQQYMMSAPKGSKGTGHYVAQVYTYTQEHTRTRTHTHTHTHTQTCIYATDFLKRLLCSE